MSLGPSLGTQNMHKQSIVIQICIDTELCALMACNMSHSLPDLNPKTQNFYVVSKRGK